MKIPNFYTIALFVFTGLCAPAFAQKPASSIVDILALGNSQSEKSHKLEDLQSETLTGGLNQPARRLLPVEPASWQGGKLVFTMKVDPDKQNYFTAKFWGSEKSSNRLILFCDGKQIGYRHLGDIDVLDIGSDEPMYNDRFFYNTSPLPIEITKGKTEVQLEIRSNGPIWGYGTNFEQYQKPMNVATRGIYSGYTHTSGIYAPTIRYNNGTFYMVTTNQRNGGNFFVTAKNAAGPWSEPIWVKEQPGIDPSYFKTFFKHFLTA